MARNNDNLPETSIETLLASIRQAIEAEGAVAGKRADREQTAETKSLATETPTSMNTKTSFDSVPPQAATTRNQLGEPLKVGARARSSLSDGAFLKNSLTEEADHQAKQKASMVSRASTLLNREAREKPTASKEETCRVGASRLEVETANSSDGANPHRSFAYGSGLGGSADAQAGGEAALASPVFDEKLAAHKLGSPVRSVSAVAPPYEGPGSLAREKVEEAATSHIDGENPLQALFWKDFKEEMEADEEPRADSLEASVAVDVTASAAEKVQGEGDGDTKQQTIHSNDLSLGEGWREMRREPGAESKSLLLKQTLREWADENLSQIAEKVIREEVRRLLARAFQLRD